MAGGRLTRRQLIGRAGAGAALLALPAGPVFARRSRPALTHGIQSGDVSAHSACVWARGDRASRMLVEIDRTPAFARAARIDGPALTTASGFTGKLRLRGLPAGTELFYRVTLEDPSDPGLRSAPLTGSFRTAPRHRRDVSFCWSGDLAGQGWGINPEIGGYRIFRAMEALDPDFFICSGDTVYADNPISASVTLPDGRVYRNVVTDAKAKVAETLDEFRGQYAYNLLDESLRSFAARVPQVNQWDDHETHNNWCPGELIDDARYHERRADVLAARARQAFFEWLPIAPRQGDAEGRVYRHIPYGPLLDVFALDMRTYRDTNGRDRYPRARRGLLGERQRAWLERELVASTATWKVLATDLPLGLVVPDPNGFEAVAQGDGGAPLGREHELAAVLSAAKRHGVTGIICVTADVHYTAAHHYDPARAAFTDFDPFWEFVSGPLNAGAAGPNALDPTFGPEAVFVAAPPRSNTSPADGFQFFGHVAIDAASGAMTVSLRDLDGRILYAVTLPAPS